MVDRYACICLVVTDRLSPFIPRSWSGTPTVIPNISSCPRRMGTKSAMLSSVPMTLASTLLSVAISFPSRNCCSSVFRKLMRSSSSTVRSGNPVSRAHWIIGRAYLSTIIARLSCVLSMSSSMVIIGANMLVPYSSPVFWSLGIGMSWCFWSFIRPLRPMYV